MAVPGGIARDWSTCGGRAVAAAVCIVAAMASVALARQAAVAKPPAGEAAPADTVAVERGPLEVALVAKGPFEPVDAVVVEFRPLAWEQPLEIRKVVPHGARVAAGEPLVEFDTRKLDLAIEDLAVELTLGEKALEVARKELPVAEAMHPLELAEAERQGRIAGEDLARFLAVEKAAAEETARFGLRAAEERLKYAREELRQLEQMYKDKDLTEETEEMILQRTRFEVTQAEFGLKRAAENSEEDLLLGIPRRETDARRRAETAALSLEKARATLPLALAQKKLALAKLEHDRARSQRRFEELQKDRAAAVVRSPRAGMVYLGRLRDGNWSTAAVAAKAIAGQTAAPGEIEFTVFDPDRMQVRARIEEKQLHLLGAGLAGGVEPTGYPDAVLPVTLGPFAPVSREGGFDAVFTVAAKEGGPKLLPGMTGAVRCVVVRRPEALTLPATAVFRDDDGGRHVYRAKADGGWEKQPVKTGRASGDRAEDRIEILEGVAAGDRVRTKKP